MAEGTIETGHSFAQANSNRWVKHTVGLDIDYVVGHLDEPATESFYKLTLLNKLLMVRAVTELSVCRFRQTNDDPDYTPSRYDAWVMVIHQLIGEEGLERLGV